MENKENAQQKKAWVTPELMMETVEGTEGKSSHSMEFTFGFGTTIGPS